jgi:uncharacterized DUF497 family protein
MPGEITQFEWDENKREQNLAKHGVDFLCCAGVRRSPGGHAIFTASRRIAGRPPPLSKDD